MDTNVNHTTSKSQSVGILNYLKQGNSLTGLEALNIFGCMSLPKRISELVREGNAIKKTWEVTTTGKRIIRYSLN